ncbi:MAG: small multi-drug export protein [Clostridia bacterium]|nr:small multi-drug export protein [Clostridia bacterium]
MDANLILGVTDSIQSFFATVFGGNAWLATIIVSMIPLIELKGGIIFGQSPDFFDEPLTKWEAFGCGIIAGAVVAVALTFLLKPLFTWLKKTKAFRKFAMRMEKSFHAKAVKIDNGENSKKKSGFKRMLGVFLFTAVPLPLTGMWTGTAIAVFLDMKWWQCLVSTISGNIVAGLIITLVSWVFSEWLYIVFYVILGIAAAVLVYMVVKMVIDSRKEKKAALSDEEIEPDNSNTEE